ncbi:hypothetical protein ACN27F_26570 [Solwaraspora sp. WMMB335]|uniref:hypothetical protein n=1 Tax=Solwaraspora sp. WMMB335 TaxID=3404118 RepID=UPI003B93147A
MAYLVSGRVVPAPSITAERPGGGRACAGGAVPGGRDDATRILFVAILLPHGHRFEPRHQRG